MTLTLMEKILHYLNTYTPHAILLHGSRARGDHTPQSDMDIIVVTEKTDDVTPHVFSGIHLDLSSVFPKKQVIRTGNTPIWPLKILYDNNHQYGAQILQETKKAYEQGPAPLNQQDWQNRKNYTERLMQRIESRGDDFLVRQYYLGDLYERMIRYWFEKKQLWTMSAYRALPYLKKDDTTFYEHLQALWTDDFPESIQRLPDIFIRVASVKDAEDIAKVHVRAWKESYKEIISESYLSQISFHDCLQLRNQILSTSSPHKINLVATHQEKIIGFCDAGPARETSNEYIGEIYAIYLLEKYKNLGMGSKLLAYAMEHLRQNSLIPCIAWALEDNKTACRFYEKNGGEVFSKKIVEIGGQGYTEISYIFG